jgi:hypothetical protein
MTTVLMDHVRDQALAIGARFDAPVESKDGWVTAASYRPGADEKLKNIIGRGKTEDEALTSLADQLPKPHPTRPAHCATCTCE